MGIQSVNDAGISAAALTASAKSCWFDKVPLGSYDGFIRKDASADKCQLAFAVGAPAFAPA